MGDRVIEVASTTTTTIELAPSGKTVPCHAGDTVLAALERAGLALPNNCRAGACGECKTKVLSGEVDQGVVLDMALSDVERADGYRLMCMAKPTTAVLEIDFGADDARPKLFPPKDRVLCVVTDTVMRTPRIKEIHLRPVGEALRYWPGQYVMVGDERNGVTPKPYSIANAPRTDGDLVLLVSRSPDGRTSAWMHEEVEVGARVTIAGPYGLGARSDPRSHRRCASARVRQGCHDRLLGPLARGRVRRRVDGVVDCETSAVQIRRDLHRRRCSG